MVNLKYYQHQAQAILLLVLTSHDYDKKNKTGAERPKYKKKNLDKSNVICN